MENRSCGSGADALASGGLAGVGAESPPPLPPPPLPLSLEETTDTKTPPKELELEGTVGEIRDMMDLDVVPSVEEVSAVAPPPPPPPPPDIPPPQIANSERTMTTPPPPPSRPPANATPTHSPTTAQHQQQTPRDLRQILQAAGSTRTGFPRHGSVPPSPVVKPGALHEFEVSDPTSPATRRRSSATAGIAGLEELRNRIEAEKGNGFRPANGDAGPLDQLIQATTGAGEYVDGFGELLSNQRTHVIDAFVRLDFDDGHVFYVRNSSVVFGRAEGASSNSFQQLGPDGSTVIGSNPFSGFDPTTTPGAMSMKREKKKRRKKKGDTSTGTPMNKSTTSGASSAGYPDSSRRGSAFAHRQTFPMFRDGSATNFPFPFPAPSHEVPIIHLPLTTSDVEAAAAPPRKNISRKHAVLNYNFAKRRFELKITGKNGAFVEDEFVQCDTTWVVGSDGMRVQIGGVGFKVVVPVVPGGGFDSAPKGRGKGGKGKMSTSFTDEHGNEVQTDFSEDDDEDEEMKKVEGSGGGGSDESMEDSDDDEDEEIEQVEGSGGGGSDESMEDSDESGDEDDEGSEEEERGGSIEDDEAQEGDVENSEGESEEEESDEEVDTVPLPEPVTVEKKRGRGRPRKDEAEIVRQELERVRAKEKARDKERRHKEKLEVAKRVKEAEREKERERKRQEEIKQKEERARQKERVRREKEQQKEQKKLHLPQPKQKEEPKKATKLYLPTPAAKKEADKSLTVQTKKGPGRPPKPKQSPPPPLQRMPMPPPMSSTAVSASSRMPEPEQVFSPSNPLMAVAAFNATTPAIDPALYNSAPPYTPIPIQGRASPQTTNKPAREPKLKKEKPPVRKRTPSPEIRECDYPPEALLKPAASYVILIHEAITNSEENALTLPQIYKAIERKYPYFKVRVTTTGWQSSVRHNLGAHKAFCKVTRSGKGWMWGINEGVSIEKEKNKANIAASRPPAYQPPVQQPNIGLPYQNGNGGYHQQQPNGYPAHNIGVSAYVDQNHAGSGQRPTYQQPLAPPMPQYQMSPQQLARIPPMPMAYQPPTQTPSVAASLPVAMAASIGQVNRQPSHQFPNAPIPLPAGNHPATQPTKQNGAPPEMLAAIQGLQKQLSLLTSQNQGSTAGPSTPGSVSPAILAQAQQLLAGLMSGKHTGRGASGNTDLVRQLTKAIQQGAGRNGAAIPVKSAPVVSSPQQAPAAPSTTMRRTTPTPTPAPAPAPAPVQIQAASMQPGPSPRPGPAVDFKNLPPEQKKKLYRALLLAKEKKEKEKEGLKEAVAGSPPGVKRPLDDGGAGPVAKKVDTGGVGGGRSPA